MRRVRDGLMRLGAPVREAYFPDLADYVYLDTATQGVPPAGVVGALTTAVQGWSAGRADHTRWEQEAEAARALVARLLGASGPSVAIVPSHVAAASVIAHQLPAARVVVPSGEYRSNLLPWITSRPTDQVRLVPAPATTERLCDAIDEGVDLVAVSSVQSADGLRVDLPRVVERAHACGALVYVDASQSLGIDTSLSECGADFVGAVGYKWLLGARGAAYLYVAPSHQRRFQPLLPSPQSAQDVAEGIYYGTAYYPWPDARRFDQPPAWLCWVAAAEAARLLVEVGVPALEAHALDLAGRFRTGIADLGYAESLVPVDQPSPIVSIRVPEPQTAVWALYSRQVKAAARPGAVRFAFHLFNDVADVERALGALPQVAFNPRPVV